MPAAGELVIWQAGAQAGTMSPAQSSTGGDGVATSTWTLGGNPAQLGMTAFVGSTSGPSLSFGAIAGAVSTGPTATILLREAGGSRFEPAFLIVPVGTTVTWTWSDGQHDLTPSGVPVFPGDPVLRNTPAQYQFTFTVAGRYYFYCANHGTPTTGMRGAVIVQ